MINPQKEEKEKLETSDTYFMSVRLPEMKKFDQQELDLEPSKVEKSDKEQNLNTQKSQPLNLDPQQKSQPKTNNAHFTPTQLPEMKKFHEKELDLDQNKLEKSNKERERDLLRRRYGRPKQDQDLAPKRQNPAPRQREVSFTEALAQAKSAAFNRSSIGDIESKTAKVMSMIAGANNLKDARDLSQNQGQGQVNASSANVTNNNQSVTSISTDFLSGLRRDYQQMPSWRANIA